jgi:hypothetical protein
VEQWHPFLWKIQIAVLQQLAAVAQIIDITKILILHGILDSLIISWCPMSPARTVYFIIIIFKHVTIKLYKQQSFCASISAIKMHIHLRLILNCHLKQTRGFRTS